MEAVGGHCVKHASHGKLLGAAALDSFETGSFSSLSSLHTAF